MKVFTVLAAAEAAAPRTKQTVAEQDAGTNAVNVAAVLVGQCLAEAVDRVVHLSRGHLSDLLLDRTRSVL
jgi:hypothetical protein